jgi:hypothetical protein
MANSAVSEDKPLQKGDIVQINPAHDEIFGGCLMVVTEPKSWGAQGYFDMPGKGKAYYRCETANMVKVGFAEWIFELGDNLLPIPNRAEGKSDEPR